MEGQWKDVKMKIKGLFCFFFLLEMCSCCDASRTINMESQKSIDIEKYLKRINKTPVKSIKSPDGDIIDCVAIYKQPAFDHPLLKNHSIQMRPNYYPEGLFTDKKLSENTEFENKDNDNNSETIIHQMWHKIGRCPEGTIPIRRSTKEELLRAESIERFGMKSPGSIPMPKSATRVLNGLNNHEYAIGFVDNDKFYGAKASITVWQPNVEQSDELSSSQMWIIGGPVDSGVNTIEAGWQVLPSLYKDNLTRLFTFWTTDGSGTTGCYNLVCPGFVQTSKVIALGSIIQPVSSYSGIQQYIDLLIFKNTKDGNWWLIYGKEPVGYWPASLFTRLKDSATVIQMGGEVINDESGGQHTTTAMGSGHFSKEGSTKASYFKNIQVVDSTNAYKDPPRFDGFSTKANCYDVSIQNGGEWGRYFFYGGPGRNPNCP